MLTRIRNANLVKARSVNVIKTNLTIKIAEILKKEGFIKSFEEFGPVFITQNGLVHKYISLTLKYKGPKLIGFITGLKRVSKSGLRIYSRQRDIPKVLGGIGMAVCLLPFIQSIKTN